MKCGPDARDYLCKLCFADDLLVIAAFKQQLHGMLDDILRVIQGTGLTIHEGKSKILCNLFCTGSGRSSCLVVS
eukprot:11422064-Karenia_brevis.AAC.1